MRRFFTIILLAIYGNFVIFAEESKEDIDVKFAKKLMLKHFGGRGGGYYGGGHRHHNHFQRNGFRQVNQLVHQQDIYPVYQSFRQPVYSQDIYPTYLQTQVVGDNRPIINQQEVVQPIYQGRTVGLPPVINQQAAVFPVLQQQQLVQPVLQQQYVQPVANQVGYGDPIYEQYYQEIVLPTQVVQGGGCCQTCFC